MSKLPSGLVWKGSAICLDSYSCPLARWIEWKTEIRVPKTRRLNLESFGDSKTTFYTTLPFQNLMSFQRHLFAWDRSRPHYSGPFYLWHSAGLPLPSSYITQTSYLRLTSSPRPYLRHTVTWTPSCPILGDRYWQNAYLEGVDNKGWGIECLCAERPVLSIEHWASRVEGWGVKCWVLRVKGVSGPLLTWHAMPQIIFVCYICVQNKGSVLTNARGM